MVEIAVNELISTIVMGVFAILLGLLSYGVKVGIGYLKSKAKSEISQSALDRLESVIYASIKATNETVGKELKVAISDGKIDKSELLSLKDTVRNQVLANMSEDIKESVSYTVIDLNSYINDLIEVSLAEIKGKIEE